MYGYPQFWVRNVSQPTAQFRKNSPVLFVSLFISAVMMYQYYWLKYYIINIKDQLRLLFEWENISAIKHLKQSNDSLCVICHLVFIFGTSKS